MNECSKSFTEMGEEWIKLLSCQRAYIGENILHERCYGKLEGITREPPEILTDNWFCCELVPK